MHMHLHSFYKNLSMQVVNVDSWTAPMTASFFSPPLKIMTVGILRMPYLVAIEGLTSVLTLKHLSFPAYSLANLSMTGWIMRHGPHHGAQNSTKTGESDASTRDCQVDSVTAGTSAVFKELMISRCIRWKSPNLYCKCNHYNILLRSSETHLFSIIESSYAMNECSNDCSLLWSAWKWKQWVSPLRNTKPRIPKLTKI